MAETANEVWITGIGLVSSLGEGIDAHWDALERGDVHINDTTFAPHLFHPIAAVNFDLQIPKKGDQRQMEAWQRIGTYAAGLALDSAGIKGNAEILSRIDMIAAAGGGERDKELDFAIMTAQARGDSAPAAINEKLMNGLRPTLFLAQLSNLLAGNISIVHGVTGSSRTFMGEEAAGIDAVRIALARILAGQSDIALVGAANNAERSEILMLYEFNGLNVREKFVPLWERKQSGLVMGSGGVFLVIESRKHAEARGAKPFAKLTTVVADQARRADDASSVHHALDALWAKAGAQGRADAIISGATGVNPATSDERAFLEKHGDLPLRTTATAFGHFIEGQLPLAIAVAALSIARGKLVATHDKSGVETPSAGKPKSIAAVAVGHWRGEGIALVEAID